MKRHKLKFVPWKQVGKMHLEISEEYSVCVDHGQSLWQLVERCNFREIVLPDHIPKERGEDIPSHAVYRWVHFECGGNQDFILGSSRLRKILADLGYLGGTLREMLSFFHSLKRPRPLEYDAIALGSTWPNSEEKALCVPFITRSWILRLTMGIGYFTDIDAVLVRKTN